MIHRLVTRLLDGEQLLSRPMPPDPFTVEPDFPFHLKVQRLTEELASAQKKLREYEDLCRC